MNVINDPLVGTTYDDRYRIEKRIGAGGMANVYLAEDETLGRRVAIKVLHQRYAEDSQFVERFLREASAAAKLNHPNIVQVYDRGQSDATYYIAMEFVDGMTLKDLVRRRGGLTEQECLAYGRQALHALRFAHRNGIVHRDVKPHNMMVDTDGRLKIADFGIARAAADADSGLTEAGSIVGTAQYLSPEQAQGQDVNAASDLYSLGVVMFEMATGRVPFDGDSPVNVALQHVKDPVPTPSSIKRDVSPALESIILKAMEKDPTRRYATADEMLADLDRAREGSQTQAMTQVIGGVGAAGATTVTRVTPIMPAAAPASSRVYETPVAPEPAWPDSGWDEDERDGRSSPLRWILPLLIVLILLGAAAYFLLRPQGDPVPDVVGQTQRAAIAEIRAEGFVEGDITQEPSDSVKQGIVIEQTPGAGDKLEAGEEIDLIVSSGPEAVEIPTVRGMEVAAARNLIEDAGFRTRVGRAEPNEEIEEGKVVRTSPQGTAPKGAMITVYASSGPEAETVPNVVGMSEEQATTTLEEAGFTVAVETADSPKPAGEVIKQDPPSGSELEPEEQVTIIVASGANVVPNVIGRNVDAAEREIQQAGFRVTRVEEPNDDPARNGDVISTEPDAGARVDVGDTVTVVFYGEATAEPAPDDEAPIEPPVDG